MKVVISKTIGYLFLIISIVFLLWIIMVSLHDGTLQMGYSLWYILILLITETAGFLMTFWKENIAAYIMLAMCLVIGLPSFFTSIYSGVIFGLPLLISGLAFLSAYYLSPSRQTYTAPVNR